MTTTVQAVRIALVATVLGVLGAPLTAAAGAGLTHGPAWVRPDGTSLNWSGYVTHAGTFESVSADWIQPAGQCTSTDTYAAFWVGLDGFNDRTVEQTGSEVDCRGGSPVSYAWYEMYPRASVTLKDAVAPGDRFRASVTADGGGQFTLMLADVTEGWTNTVTRTQNGAKLSSAEVIAEAPCCTSAGRFLRLTDFGTVQFGDAAVDGAPLGDATHVKLDMRTGPIGGQTGPNTDTTSALTHKKGFSVTWDSN